MELFKGQALCYIMRMQTPIKTSLPHSVIVDGLLYQLRLSSIKKPLPLFVMLLISNTKGPLEVNNGSFLQVSSFLCERATWIKGLKPLITLQLARTCCSQELSAVFPALYQWQQWKAKWELGTTHVSQGKWCGIPREPAFIPILCLSLRILSTVFEAPNRDAPATQNMY